MFDCLKEAAQHAPTCLAFNSITFREFDRLTDRMANLLSTSGISPGDRIAFYHPASLEAAALFFAAWRIGASICPLSLRLPASQIESHLVRLDAKAYIDSFPIVPQMRKSQYEPLSFPAALLFTSGTTSVPKIAVLSIENLLSNARPATRQFDLRIGDHWLLNLPLYHVGGIGILLRCILAKACVALDETNPKITHISAVPTQLYRATPIYKHLRCVVISGASISYYPQNLPCYLAYGLTEMGSVVTAQGTSTHPTPPFTVGLPLLDRELHISPTQEILVRGNCLFEGYWENGQIVKPFDEAGWFTTGDLGTMSKDGLIILGRKDWQFISGGENIQPEEIERVLLSVSTVYEAAVVPIDDPEFGQRPVAVLRASGPSLDPSYLKKFLLKHLPKFKIPIRFIYVDELPKIGLKINRKSISEIANKNI